MKIIDTITKSLEFHTAPDERVLRMSDKAVTLRDELNVLIDSKKIDFEEGPCLCGNDVFSLISEYDKFGIKQKTVICTQCGLVQSNPRMTAEATDWFYGSDFYGNLYGRIQGKNTTEFILNEAKARPQLRYELIKKNVDYASVRSVLEIGCAGGWSLYPFFQDGKKVVGYDYGPTLVEAGKKLGMDLRVGNIENDPNEQETYDVILLCHVYEHLPRPIETMRSLMKRLAPGGHIYIEVPDMKELSILGFVSAHSYYYTEKTFLHFFGIAGLKPVVYGKEDIAFGSQAALLERAPKNFTPLSYAGEYARMRNLIEREDKKILLRQKVLGFSKKLGISRGLKHLAHLYRKASKRRLPLETIAVKSES